jgi:PAS domain S-box-containing protein
MDPEVFQRAFADAAVALAILDLAGRFRGVNRAFCALLGYDEAALLGTDCLTLTDAEDRERHRTCLGQLREGAVANVTLELRYRTGAGNTIAVVNQVALLRGTAAESGFIAHVQERQPLALRRAREEFGATVSHELRTPLTVIQAGLGLLASSAGDRLLPPERDLLDNLARNALRLKQLIGDLLSLNQLRVATLQQEMASLDLREALYAATTPLYPLLEKRRQDLSLALDEPLPIEGDARQLEQALLNLLYAVHTAAPPTARLVVRGWSSADTVRLALSANGPGEFGADGAGIALTVARGIIELHGGHLLTEPATSWPPQPTFTITLPRSRALLATGGETTTMTEDGDGTQVADRGR